MAANWLSSASVVSVVCGQQQQLVSDHNFRPRSRGERERGKSVDWNWATVPIKCSGLLCSGVWSMSSVQFSSQLTITAHSLTYSEYCAPLTSVHSDQQHLTTLRALAFGHYFHLQCWTCVLFFFFFFILWRYQLSIGTTLTEGDGLFMVY